MARKRDSSASAEDATVAKKARIALEDALDIPLASNSQPFVKLPYRDKFHQLCRQYGWTPTEDTRERIISLLGFSTWKAKKLEPIMFAFVQHLVFSWENDTIFVGFKSINNERLAVWYRAEPIGNTGSLAAKLYLSAGKQPFPRPEDGPRVDEWSRSFTAMFNLSGKSKAYQNTAMEGVFLILKEFPQLRRYRDPERPGKLIPVQHQPELPFLPDSDWMKSPQPSRISPSMSQVEDEDASGLEQIGQDEDLQNGELGPDDASSVTTGEEYPNVDASLSAIEDDQLGAHLQLSQYDSNAAEGNAPNTDGGIFSRYHETMPSIPAASTTPAATGLVRLGQLLQDPRVELVTSNLNGTFGPRIQLPLDLLLGVLQ